MERIELGKTGVSVSAMGLGAMHLSLEGRPSREQAMEVIHRTLDAGINFIDTADAYCRDEDDKHHNERLIRDALASYKGDGADIYVATKGGLMRYGGQWPRNGDPDHLRATIRESVEALGGDPIFLWQHHAPDPNVPVVESLQSVRDAVDDGLIRHVGVSNYKVEHLEQARNVVEITTVQNQYSLWHRRPEHDGTLAYCEQHGLTFLPWGPLGGKNRAKSFARYEVLNAIGDRHDVSPQCIALAWLRHRSPIILPIPGASRPESIEDSVRAIGVALTDDEAERIEQAIETEG